MGDYAELILDGDVCELCGLPFDDPGQGFPRKCEQCEPKKEKKNDSKNI